MVNIPAVFAPDLLGANAPRRWGIVTCAGRAVGRELGQRARRWGEVPAPRGTEDEIAFRYQSDTGAR